MEVGIQPWKANEKEIELAEKLVQKFRYIEGAADEFRKVISANN